MKTEGLTRNDIIPGKKYRIKYKDKYSNRVATARGVSFYGDVTLEFKNGKQVLYHACWLEGVE